jgi:hypothetical protein
LVRFTVFEGVQSTIKGYVAEITATFDLNNKKDDKKE